MLLYVIACFISLVTLTNGYLSFFDQSNHATAPTDLEDLEPGSYDDILKMNQDRHHDPREVYDIISYNISRSEETESSIESAEDQEQTDRQNKMYNGPETTTLSSLTEEHALRADERPVGQKYKVYQKSATVSSYSDTYYNESLSGRRAYTRDYPNSKGKARDERKKGQFLNIQVWDYDKYDSFKDVSYGFLNLLTKRVRNDFGAKYDYELQGTYVTSCYNCGHLEYGKWWKADVEARIKKGKILPNETLCADAFESDDWRARTKRRYLREECYNNTQTKHYTFFWNRTKGTDIYRAENYFTFHDCVKIEQDIFGKKAIYHSGQPLTCFGPYVGKCFKRFVDVGKIYTERGCSSWPPHKSNTFASHRFEKLEYLLHDVDEGCASSPMASLTPFSRSVSLYVRYHVCVCTGSYCNAATLTAAASVVTFLLCVFFNLR